ncbi:hypothetical protein SDC9_90216 [bioreactor metagenome]|uniref:Uncharacterized protein n=1 Tax=bioreactor metagenome TaxID=1076179 RepID=A0A644ZRC4_9ZZZZ
MIVHCNHGGNRLQVFAERFGSDFCLHNSVVDRNDFLNKRYLEMDTLIHNDFARLTKRENNAGFTGLDDNNAASEDDEYQQQYDNRADDSADGKVARFISKHTFLLFPSLWVDFVISIP